MFSYAIPGTDGPYDANTLRYIPALCLVLTARMVHRPVGTRVQSVCDLAQHRAQGTSSTSITGQNQIPKLEFRVLAHYRRESTHKKPRSQYTSYQHSAFLYLIAPAGTGLDLPVPGMQALTRDIVLPGDGPF
eukprot:2265140-Rhodomonas_salina.1